MLHAASWFHDASAVGKTRVGHGNNRVISATVVRLRFLDRPIALPVGFALVRNNSDDTSRLALTRWLSAHSVQPCPAGRSMWSPTPPMRAGRCEACPLR